MVKFSEENFLIEKNCAVEVHMETYKETHMYVHTLHCVELIDLYMLWILAGRGG